VSIHTLAAGFRALNWGISSPLRKFFFLQRQNAVG
jgi:hypothetical protein